MGMPTQVALEDDEALVLFELLASGRLAESIDIPERNALWALETALQRQLAAPFSSDYAAQLELARTSLVARLGD